MDEDEAMIITNSPYPIDDLVLDKRNVIYEGATDEDIQRYFEWMEGLRQRGEICSPGESGEPEMYPERVNHLRKDDCGVRAHPARVGARGGQNLRRGGRQGEGAP